MSGYLGHMFEQIDATSTQAFEGLLSVLARVDTDVTDAERIDQLSVLERVKSAVAAAQARITVDFVESQEQVAREWRERAKECADDNDFEGWRAAREQARRASLDGLGSGDQSHAHTARGRSERRKVRRPGADLGVAGQVALSRRVSPSRGSRLVATSLILVREMPHTMTALANGTLSEGRAELVTREVAILTPEQRSLVDAELEETLGEQLGLLGDQELSRRVRAIAYRIDPASVLNRCRAAEADRRTSIRPAPDAMAYLTAFLPLAQAVACHAALTKAAATGRAEGDQRTKGQLMADTLVTRVTGQAEAPVVPVEIQLVITDRTLLAGDDTPAHVPGYGPVPAGWARELIAGTQPGQGVSDRGSRAEMWLRRLYTHPGTGTLVGMDSRRRVFEAGLRRFLVARDGTCRTPWCDAPIQHIDHVVDHAAGGATSADNGQGYCVRCNHTKQHPGWRTDLTPEDVFGDDRHTVVATTPTGHRYPSTAPPVIAGQPPPDLDDSPLERHYRLLLAA